MNSSMSGIQAEINELVVTTQDLFTVKCCGFAALAWVLYDIAITLEDEIDLIWRAKWTLTKVLYIFTRYFTAFDLAFTLKVTTILYPADSFCQPYLWYSVYSGPIATSIVGSIILIMRLWAMYGGNRKVLYFCVAIYLIDAAGYIVTPLIVFRRASPEGNFFGSLKIPLSGCFYQNIKDEWVGTVTESIDALIHIIFLIMALYCFFSSASRKMGRQTAAPLLGMLARDNSIYFLPVACSTIGYSVLTAVLPQRELAQLGPFISTAAFSVTATRMILNMRLEVDIIKQRERDIELSAQSEMQFRTNPLPSDSVRLDSLARSSDSSARDQRDHPGIHISREFAV